MADPADLVTALLARDIVDAVHRRGLRVLALTTPVSLVAGLLARRTGAPGLALSGGFGRFDADPVPAVTAGEHALGMHHSPRSMSAETFMALVRGRVGVVVVPAQVDARAALNLSGIGGEHGRPAVALPGSRGLPDNNHSLSTVWYFVPEIATRRLVPAVDFVSGAPPPPGVRRLLVSPRATLEFDAATGWRVVGVTEGTSVEDVRAATGFTLAADVPAVHQPPTAEEMAVLGEVDPHGLRRLDLGSMPADELAAVRAAEAAEFSRP